MSQKVVQIKRYPTLKAFKLIPNSIVRAYLLCIYAHRGQKRKITGEPVASHPIAVYKILKQYTNDPNLLAAALLHDIIEDTDFTYEDIMYLFNYVVADFVQEVTEIKQSPSGENLPWLERKNELLSRLAAKGTVGALEIKVADHIHNRGSDVKNATKACLKKADFNSSIMQQIWYSEMILSIARTKGAHPDLTQQLNQTIDAFEQKFAQAT